MCVKERKCLFSLSVSAYGLWIWRALGPGRGAQSPKDKSSERYKASAPDNCRVVVYSSGTDLPENLCVCTQPNNRVALYSEGSNKAMDVCRKKKIHNDGCMNIKLVPTDKGAMYACVFLLVVFYFAYILFTHDWLYMKSSFSVLGVSVPGLSAAIKIHAQIPMQK